MNDKKSIWTIDLIGAIAAATTITLALTIVLVQPTHAQQPQTQSNNLDVTPGMAAMTVRQRCSNCHAIAPDVKRFAPPLVGLIGRKAGSYQGFAYSGKIKSLDMTWTAAALNDWLAGTTFKTPDIRQRHVGIDHPELRKAVVAHIATLQN